MMAVTRSRCSPLSGLQQLVSWPTVALEGDEEKPMAGWKWRRRQREIQMSTVKMILLEERKKTLTKMMMLIVMMLMMEDMEGQEERSFEEIDMIPLIAVL